MGLGKPISKWAMQETTGTTVVDTMGANTGTATSGNARRFNGTSDYVSFTNQIIPLGAKTIRFKYRRNGLPSTTSIILDNNSLLTTNNGTSVYINSSSGYIYFGSMTGSGQRIAATTNVNVCDNKWHEIMFSWDGTVNANGVKVFVDDMVTPTYQGTATSTETTNATYNLWMGRNANTANQWGGFDIDDLQITNAAMGAGTVAAWWNMDDTANTAMVDSSTNAWAATVSGTTVIASPDSMPIIVSDGVGGYCRRFNGRSDRITYTSQVLPLGAKNVRFKIKTTDTDANTKLLVDNSGYNTVNNGFGIFISGGQIGVRSFKAVSGQDRFLISYSTPINDGIWHDVLFTWDGTTNTNGVKLYIDDMTTPKSQLTANAVETSNATNSLTIGCASGTPQYYFQGDLQNIQITVGTGTERTDPKDLQIGDFIAANYAASSGAFGTFSDLGVSPTSFIPPASSATPNGGLYFMYVGDDFLGRKILASDRNVQQSISWDTLNNAGVAAGSGLPYQYGGNTTPTFVSYTNGSCVVSASSEYNAAHAAWKAFDKASPFANTGWSSALNTGWLKFDFGTGNERAIARYTITAPDTANDLPTTCCPQNWTFEGSNTGAFSGEQVVLDTRTGHTNWNSKEKRAFTFANSVKYRFYRVNITLNNGASNAALIDELEMMEAFFPNTNTTFRLLTGGTTSTDKDNEWDKYIVNSTLNGTITAGDNNVWNWSGTFAWASSTDTAGSIYRAIRGRDTATSFNGQNTNGVLPSVCFRPILIVEYVSTPPTFSGSVTPTTITTGDVTVSGTVTDPSAGDQVQYNIFVGNTQIYPTSGYTVLAASPVSVNYTILNSYFVLGANTVKVNMLDSLGAASNYTVTVTKTNPPPTFSGSLSATTVHTENTTLSGTISDANGDQVQYKVLINGVQKYPVSGWTALVNQPLSISYVIQNTDLSIGANPIQLDFQDSLGGVGTSWAGTVTVTESPPTASMSLDKTSVHAENVVLSGSITDPDIDNVSYRILLNGAVIQDWSASGTSPVAVNYTVSNTLFTLGNNTLTVEHKDFFKGSMAGTNWVGTITQTSAAPTVSITMTGMRASIQVGDPEGDQVQFLVKLNGTQIYPATGFTDLAPPTVLYERTFRSNEVNLGVSNIIHVDAKDKYGATVSQESTFIGGYVGLMFSDVNGNYYTTDLGVLLQYLDFGTLVAGQTSLPQKVRLTNKYPYPVANIRLTMDQSALQSAVKVWFDTAEAFGNPSTTITFPTTYNFDAFVEFWVRVETTRLATAGGMFDIFAKANPT